MAAFGCVCWEACQRVPTGIGHCNLLSAACIHGHGALHAPLRARPLRPARGLPQRLGWSMVPVQFFEPQRQAQIFFSRGVCRSARVMP